MENLKNVRYLSTLLLFGVAGSEKPDTDKTARDLEQSRKAYKEWLEKIGETYSDTINELIGDEQQAAFEQGMRAGAKLMLDLLR